MSIVVPLIMYPALLWAGFSAMSFVEGQAERLTSRVAISGLPAAHAPLADSLRAHDRISVIEWDGEPEEALRGVALGRLDVFMGFGPPGAGTEGLADNIQVELAYNEASDRSRAARVRVESTMRSYRETWVDEARTDLGIRNPAWADFAFVRDDVATAEEGIRFVLGLLVPFLTLIMVALASYYPAIDATAGERERSTWETLMTVAAPRANVAAAKYLYVATFGAVGGLLNVTALALSLRWILTPTGGAEELATGSIPFGALPVIAMGTMLLGLLVAAGMLVFAVFARNFKEGQSMITPFYLAMIFPAILVQSPDIEFTASLAIVPVVNVALLIREAILGSIPLLPGVVTLVSMTVFVGLAVAFAQWVMRREEVFLGASEGGLGTFLKRRLGVRGREA